MISTENDYDNSKVKTSDNNSIKDRIASLNSTNTTTLISGSPEVSNVGPHVGSERRKSLRISGQIISINNYYRIIISL